MIKVPLVKDTINEKDIEKLIEWLKTNPKLTKGELTKEFEKKFSEFLKRKFSIYVNSGSSANLAMIYALILSGRLKNKNIIVPAVSWTTTVTPIIQFGLNPILCECDLDTLGLDINHLAELIELHKPSAILLVHVLGIPNKMTEIIDLCEKNDIILLEDSCESVGSTYNNIQTGNFGLMSSFSTYFGHHFSTIEGGMICTDDEELFRILISIRSHGWDRDFEPDYQHEIRKKYNVSDFKALYTFYYPGFNLRSTDLQAFLGLEQLDRLEDIINTRNRNFLIYNSKIKNNYWKPKVPDNVFVSNFAYPIIHPNRKEISENLKENGVECRPLICGSIGRQPYWIDIFGETNFTFADLVDDYGLYVPNNQDMTEEDVNMVVKLVNEKINDL